MHRSIIIRRHAEDLVKYDTIVFEDYPVPYSAGKEMTITQIAESSRGRINLQLKDSGGRIGHLDLWKKDQVLVVDSVDFK